LLKLVQIPPGALSWHEISKILADFSSAQQLGVVRHAKGFTPSQQANIQIGGKT